MTAASKLFPILLICLFLVGFSSTTQKNFNPEEAVIAVLKDGQLQLKISKEILTNSAQKADKDWAQIEKIQLQENGKKKALLILKGQCTEGNSMIKAVQLVQKNKTDFLIDNTQQPIAHKCRSSCCSACDLKIESGFVMGCDCKNRCDDAEENSYCAHTLIGKVAHVFSTLKK